mgnify:FL=1
MILFHLGGGQIMKSTQLIFQYTLIGVIMEIILIGGGCLSTSLTEFQKTVLKHFLRSLHYHLLIWLTMAYSRCLTPSSTTLIIYQLMYPSQIVSNWLCLFRWIIWLATTNQYQSNHLVYYLAIHDCHYIDSMFIIELSIRHISAYYGHTICWWDMGNASHLNPVTSISRSEFVCRLWTEL